MFALIFENRVVDISNEKFPVAEAMNWTESQNDVKIGYFYIDGVFKDTLESDIEKIISLKNQKIAQCKAYLSSTDWQIIRLSDPTSGQPLKEGVAENRSLARSLQDTIEACTTLEQLNNINVNFQ